MAHIKTNYMQDCIEGRTKEKDIERYINAWLSTDTKVCLADYLGMTKEEYILYLKNRNNDQAESVLRDIVNGHRQNLE